MNEEQKKQTPDSPNAPCDEAWGRRISAYIDGEIDAESQAAVEEHLAVCERCRQFRAAIENLKGITMNMKFAAPSDEAWRLYWKGIYNRIERGIGWIFLSAGLIILLCYGLYAVFTEFFSDPEVPTLLKIGVACAGVGCITLLVSIIREKCFRNKTERYREVDL